MQTLGANTQYLTPKYAPPDSEPHKATKITKQYLCIRPVNGSVHVDVVDDNEKPIQGEYNGSVGTSSTLYLNVSAQHRVRIRTFSSACEFKLLALTVWPFKKLLKNGLSLRKQKSPQLGGFLWVGLTTVLSYSTF